MLPDDQMGTSEATNGPTNPGGGTGLAKREAVQHKKARPSAEGRAARKLNWAARLENELWVGRVGGVLLIVFGALMMKG